MTHLLPLATLPNDNKPYRIDLIGNIGRNPSCSSNHLLDIFLRPLCSRFFQKNNILDTNHGYSKLQPYKISVGDLGRYPPLSTVVNGEAHIQHLQPNVKLTIYSSKNGTQFVSASHRDDYCKNGDYLIPFSRFQLGMAVTTPLTAIEHNGDPYSLLIPTSEIIRYFYLSSSSFNQFLFSSDSQDIYNLINTDGTSIDLDGRSQTIKLRRRFKDCDAGIITEILTSRHARTNAQRIFGGLLTLRHDNNISHYSPRVGLPFIGYGEISGRGIELPTPDPFRRNRRLLLRITDCKYQLPFDKIELDRDNPVFENNDESLTTPEDPEHAQKPIPFATIKNREGKNNPLSQPSKIPSNVTFNELENRFYETEIIPIYRNSKNRGSRPTKSTPIPHTGQSSTITTCSDSDTAQISIQPKDFEHKQESIENSKSDDFDFFNHIRKVAHYISKKESISISTLKINSISDNDLSKFPKGDSAWCNIFNDRNLYLAKIICKEKYFYLMEVERSEYKQYSTILYNTFEYTEVSTDKNYVLLKCLSWNSFERYKQTFENLGFSISTFRHANAKNQAVKIEQHVLKA